MRIKTTIELSIAAARDAQQAWALTPIARRLSIVRRLRHEIAARPDDLAATIPLDCSGSLHRSLADTLVSEVLPLLEACRFLEREAAFLLATRQESTTSRPAWLGGVSVATRRDPLGVILVIGPGNYPLFLPGVQALQALVAGNAVLWKPAPSGAGPALALKRMLFACGLDPSLLTVLDTDPSAATEAIRAGVDKVVLTGSVGTGTAVLHELAETLTPSVMELSGCDAVFVLGGADLDRVTEALSFALRLNGSATCMAPRRVFVTSALLDPLTASLKLALAGIDPVPLPKPSLELLRDLVDEATLYGARLILDGTGQTAKTGAHVGATLLAGVTPEMRIAQTDIFAPVLSIMQADDEQTMLAAHNACPYALTTAIFGPARQAEALAARLHTGTVLLNDIIVPAADPRSTFGGRKRSGFGATRGREGLLAMTAPKAILRQTSRSRRAYQPTGPIHIPFFAGLTQALHAGSWRLRWQGAKRFIQAARQIK